MKSRGVATAGHVRDPVALSVDQTLVVRQSAGTLTRSGSSTLAEEVSFVVGKLCHLGKVWAIDATLDVLASEQAQFVQDFLADWTKVMNLDRFDLT